MKSGKSFLAEVWENYRDMLRAATMYELFFRVVLPALIFPLFRLLIRGFLYLAGYQVIANNTLVSFFVGPIGVLTAIVFIVLVSLVTLAEFGGLLVLSRNSYWYLPTEGTGAFLESLRHIKKIFRPSGIKALLYILVILPFLQIGFSSALIPAINIPEYILSFILDSPWLSVLLVVVFALCVYLTTRWFFTIHFVILEDEDLATGLKHSNELTKGHKLRLLGAVFVIQIVAAIAGWLLLLIPDLLYGFIVAIENSSMLWDIFFMLFLALLGIVVTIVPLILGLPLAISYSTVLFYRWRNQFERFVPVEEKVLPEVRVPLVQRKFIRIIVIVVAVCSLLWTGFRNLTVPIPYTVAVTAHRGGGLYAPENSINGLKYAIEAGADYTEIDVQVTADNVVVITHDTNLERELGVDVNVWELTYAQIQEYSLVSGDEQDKMPTLEQFLRTAKGKIKVNIEIKTNGHDQTLISQTVGMVESLGMQTEVVITSLDYSALQKVRALNPNLKIGYIMFGVFGDPMALDVDFYCVETTFATENFIRQAHLNGREVYVWTVNDTDSMIKFRDRNVDNIITDYPEEARMIVDDNDGE